MEISRPKKKGMYECIKKWHDVSTMQEAGISGFNQCHDQFTKFNREVLESEEVTSKIIKVLRENIEEIGYPPYHIADEILTYLKTLLVEE